MAASLNVLVCKKLLSRGNGVTQENMGAGYMEAIPVAEGIQPIPVPALPPYNGFGSFEDSEQSCKNLVSLVSSCPHPLSHMLTIWTDSGAYNDYLVTWTRPTLDIVGDLVAYTLGPKCRMSRTGASHSDHFCSSAQPRAVLCCFEPLLQLL